MTALAVPVAAGASTETSRPALYPIFLDLVGRSVVVVGGGTVAEGKVEDLLETGALITVIAPQLTPRLAAWVERGLADHLPRTFRRGDLEGAFLVLAERMDLAVEELVFTEAQERGIFANVQDRLARCSFHAPARVRRGDLTVAISTAGAAPALASRLRRRLEGELGPEISRFLALVGPLRDELAREVPSFAERRERWYRLVDSPVLDLLRRGEEAAACRLIGEILGAEPAQVPS